MPFIKQIRRDQIAQGGLENLPCVSPGDRCYVAYRRLRDQWNKSPSWATAHNMYIRLHEDIEEEDDYIARDLAWRVFFHRVVMPYEEQKALENGDIL